MVGEKGDVIGTEEDVEVVIGKGGVVIGGTGRVINEDGVMTGEEEEEEGGGGGCCNRKELRR